MAKIESQSLSPKEKILQELYEHLQVAIQLEHSTLPTYFYIYWSMALHPKHANAPEIISSAAESIYSVIMEEMLHFALMSNIMRALGGSPGIKGDFAPKYPSPPPGLTPKYHFDIHLEKCDLTSIATCVRIEMPEIAHEDHPQEEKWSSIGEFYRHIIHLIKSDHLCDEDFQGGGQMPRWGGHFQIPLYDNMPVKDDQGAKWFEIHKRQDALDAIKLIIEEGEGFHKLPGKSQEKELPHFYKFLKIFHDMGGIGLKGDDYSYFHKQIFHSNVKQDGYYDQENYQAFHQFVLPMIKNPAQHLNEYSQDALLANQRFNIVYSQMLDNMHESFNSDLPRVLSFSHMFGLQEAAKEVVKYQLGDRGKVCGPSFQYILPEDRDLT